MSQLATIYRFNKVFTSFEFYQVLLAHHFNLSATFLNAIFISFLTNNMSVCASDARVCHRCSYKIINSDSVLVNVWWSRLKYALIRFRSLSSSHYLSSIALLCFAYRTKYEISLIKSLFLIVNVKALNLEWRYDRWKRVALSFNMMLSKPIRKHSSDSASEWVKCHTSVVATPSAEKLNLVQEWDVDGKRVKLVDEICHLQWVKEEK